MLRIGEIFKKVYMSIRNYNPRKFWAIGGGRRLEDIESQLNFRAYDSEDFLFNFEDTIEGIDYKGMLNLQENLYRDINLAKSLDNEFKSHYIFKKDSHPYASQLFVRLEGLLNKLNYRMERLRNL